MRRYTTVAALIRVVLPDAADVLTVLDVGANMRLRECVVDVLEYTVTWESSPNPWEAT